MEEEFDGCHPMYRLGSAAICKWILQYINSRKVEGLQPASLYIIAELEEILEEKLEELSNE